MSEESDLAVYIREQQKSFSLSQIREALIDEGMDPAKVDDAIVEVRVSEMPEIPGLKKGGAFLAGEGAIGAEPAEEGLYKLSLMNALPNGVQLLMGPTDFFKKMEKEGGYIPPVMTVLFWATAAALMIGLSEIKTGGGPALLFKVVFYTAIGAFPAAGLLAAPTMIYSTAFYVACTLLGGRGTFEASFRAIASLCVLAPIAALALFIFPWALAPLFLYGIILSIYAGKEVHGLSGLTSFCAHIVFLIGGIIFLIAAA